MQLRIKIKSLNDVDFFSDSKAEKFYVQLLFSDGKSQTKKIYEVYDTASEAEHRVNQLRELM